MEGRSQGKGKIFVLVEREGPAIAPVTFELLGTAKQIATDLRGILCAVAIGHEIADVSSKIAQFVEEVYSIDHPQLTHFKPELYLSALEQLYQDVNPDVVLMGCTVDNLGIAPRLAYRMGVQIITDCVQIAVEPDTGYLLCTKPVYGAKITSILKLTKKPYMATIRPKVMEPIGPSSATGKIIHVDPVIDETTVKVEVIEKINEETVSLNRAEAIVAGGRGVKTPKGSSS